MTLGQLINSSEDALEIAMAVLNKDRSFILLNRDKILSTEEADKIQHLINKRLDQAPLAYIINRRGFWKDIFYVNENVLIPQPDTETLVEHAVMTLLDTNLKTIDLLDLCAGSGCIGISVANDLAKKGRLVRIVLSDISQKACEVCKINADKLLDKKVSYSIVTGDLFQSVENKKFDCILTNPPYIETDVIPTLSDEVQAEPHLALDGGKDGLDLVRKIAEECDKYLNPNGFVFCEIGYNQGNEAVGIFKARAEKVELIKDLGENDRVVKASF